MKKTTNELQNEIRKADSIESYLHINRDEMMDNTVAVVLKQIIEKKKLKKADIIRKCGINEIYAYQIFSGKKEPSRDKVIALCFGMELNIDEVQTILKHANYPQLYARDQRDSIILFCIEQKKNVIDCNNMLYEYGFEIF